jgi:hypothetical protein
MLIVVDKMKHVIRYAVAVLVFCAAVAGVFSARPAGAVKPFLEQFKALYVDPKTSDHEMQIFNAAVAKKGCGLCHYGKPRSGGKLNVYGKELKKLLVAKTDAANSQKIRKALEKVADMNSKPDDADSPTFGKRIKQGKMPVGEIHVRHKGDSK